MSTTCLLCSEGKPTAIIARTFKGRGFEGIEDRDNWHGKPLGDKADAVLQQLMSITNGASLPVKPVAERVPEVDLTVSLNEPPNYKIGEKLATRQGECGLSADRVLIAADKLHTTTNYAELV